MKRPQTEPELRAAREALCAALGLEGVSPRLDQALTHPSYANERPEVGDYEKLEFLGDAVLGLCVSELLMERDGDSDEGELTVLRAALVNATALAARAEALGLGAALRLGRGADASGERHRRNVLCDALEAVFGAVYLDAGLERARSLCRLLLGAELERLRAGAASVRDAKSVLQEHLPAQGLAAPRYCVVGADGPPHARRFTVEVEVTAPDGSRLATAQGVGSSKKDAEQAAAQAALAALQGARVDEPAGAS
ncbi:MAG: ribonuclease III [Polyangiaceae bacterium]|nr:ribonuclease III [Polyangiaceae bacterium]